MTITFIYSLSTLRHTAPSGPPQNVSAVVLSATHLLLSWEPPPNEEQNGVIEYYVVTICQFESNICYTYYIEDLQYNVQNLHPYYMYECTVAAVTVDLGPSSSPITVRMFQDGKYVLPKDFKISLNENLYISIAAPSSPPLAINILILSTRSVNISWTPPPSTEQNGIIQYYLLKQLNVNSGEMQINSIYDTLAIIVNDLHPYYSYIFSLAAVTVEIGPYSMEAAITMPQDCQFSMYQLYIKLFIIISYSLLVVPTGVPMEVEATSLSPTHLDLQWLPPLPADQNGVITAYHINITELNTGTVFTFAVSGATLFFSSSTFHPFYDYSCLVSAVTIGVGPAAHIEVTTREDGND